MQRSSLFISTVNAFVLPKVDFFPVMTDDRRQRVIHIQNAARHTYTGRVHEFGFDSRIYSGLFGFHFTVTHSAIGFFFLLVRIYTLRDRYPVYFVAKQ